MMWTAPLRFYTCGSGLDSDNQKSPLGGVVTLAGIPRKTPKLDSSEFAASLEARREMWLATSSFGSTGCSNYFYWHLGALLLSIALERVTIKRFMQWVKQVSSDVATG
jgi:hypothetical protein